MSSVRLSQRPELGVHLDVLTPEYVRGRRECQKTISRGCDPAWGVVRMENPEFVLGFRNEWRDLTLWGRRSAEEVAGLARRRLGFS